MSDSEKCSLSPACSRDTIWLIGAAFVCFLLFKIIRSLWRALYSCFIADLIGLTVDWKTLGRWAVITGSTDGIGKAYAKALAAKGFNIVLVSRTREKLETVAKEIESKYKVQTRTVAVNITDNLTIYDTVRKSLEGLEIGVLVNNVGMSYDYPEYLTKIPNVEKKSDDLIKANITSCIRMTLLVLPQMESRRKGVIINVSSLSALTPVPLLNIYGSSKSFVNAFSQASQEEYKKKGIIVQAVLPGFVSTNMSKMRPSFTTCTPEAFVYWALKTVGVETRTYGYPVHKLQGYVQELMSIYLPENLNLSVNHKMLGNIRKRYYKKFGLTDDEKINTSKDK